MRRVTKKRLVQSALRLRHNGRGLRRIADPAGTSEITRSREPDPGGRLSLERQLSLHGSTKDFSTCGQSMSSSNALDTA